MLDSVAAIFRQMMPGLAHAGDDDAAVAFVQQLDGLVEVVVDAIDEAEDRRRFGAQHLAREIEAGDRSSFMPPAPLRDGVDADEPLQQRLQPVEPKRVLRVALRPARAPRALP